MNSEGDRAEFESLWHNELELLSWITWSGKGGRRDRIPLIRKCLDHPAPDVRRQAINTLSSRFQLPEMESYCREHINDPHPDVALTSLLFWPVFHKGTRNREVAAQLRHLASQQYRPPAFRATAIDMISYVLVGNTPGASLYTTAQIRSFKAAKTAQEFDQLIDWNAVDSYIEKHRRSE